MGRVLEPEVMEGDAEAAAYDELDRLWGDVIFQGFAESAARMGVRRGRVLDVGTGAGRIAIRLARLNPDLDITGIDLSNSMLDLARRNAANAEVANVRFASGDAKRIPYDDHSFDLVICHQLLHQLPEPSICVAEIGRVAKPGGGILIRDVRRLSEPAMTLALPLWCLGYSPKLREQTTASFRAGFDTREFRKLVASLPGRPGRVRAHWLTHQSFERFAEPYAPLRTGPTSPTSLSTRILKQVFVTRR
jgi:ubiquinone/menaquinone biosynthesis C-methylase UbiE